MINVHVVPISENFRGRSYGEWASEWWNWVLSEQPDEYVADAPIIFLRGNNDYDYVTENHIRVNTTSHLDMTKHAICIYEDTAIFFPVIEAELNEGDPSPKDPKRILTEVSEMRQYVRKDIEGCGPVAATIRHGDELPQRIVNNLLDFRAESPAFDLVVPAKSFLKDRMEWVFKPGVFRAVTDGYWILIRSLPASDIKYQIHFEANAPGTYYSATYDILVKCRGKSINEDRTANLLNGFSVSKSGQES